MLLSKNVLAVHGYSDPQRRSHLLQWVAMSAVWKAMDLAFLGLDNLQ